MFIESSVFSLFVLIFFLIPGLYLVDKLRVEVDFYIRLILSFVFGISFFCLLSLIIRLLNLNYRLIIMPPYLLLFIYYFLKKNILANVVKSFTNSRFTVILFILGMAVFLSIGSLQSRIDNTGLRVSSYYDSVWHLSLIKQLINNVPPDHPGFSGIKVVNYHYLYDFLIASTNKLTMIPVFNLYYHFYSLFSAFVFVLAVFGLMGIMLNRIILRMSASFLAVSMGNLSFIFILFGGYKGHSPNMFMSDSPFDQAINPFNLLAYAFLLAALIIFNRIFSNKERQLIPFFCLVAAVLGGVKIYGAVLLFLALISLFFLQGLFFKKLYLWFFTPVLFFLPLYLLTKGGQPTSLYFSPFWILDKMVGDMDKLNRPDVMLKKQYYQATGNYLRLIWYRIIETGIYLFGNLYLRIVGLFALVKLIIRKSWVIETNLLYLLIILFSFAVPLFFSQSRSSYDIIQFTPYGLLILSIITSAYLVKTVGTLSKKHLLTAIILYILLAFVAIPTNIIVFRQNLRVPETSIESEELGGLAYLSQVSNIGDIILSGDIYNMYVPALTGRQSFLTGIKVLENTGVDFSGRLEIINKYLNHYQCLDWSNIIGIYNISYVYLSGPATAYSLGLSKTEYPLIYDTKNVKIYRTKQI